MDKETKEGVKGDFLYSWKIFYHPNEETKMERFKQWCRNRGYRPLVAIDTLLDMAEWQKSCESLAVQLAQTNAKLAELESKYSPDAVEASEMPKTMGGM